MADISKITPLGSETTYNLKDATAREQANWNTNNGVKNLIYEQLYTSSTYDNLTTTLNIFDSEANVTVNGTASSSHGVNSFYYKGVGDMVAILEAPSGATGYDFRIYNAKSAPATELARVDIRNPVAEFTFTGEAVISFVTPTNASATNLKFKLMIMPKSLYDADSTFEPYALPNTKITPELIELVDSGAKNIFNEPVLTTGSAGEINVTDNGDSTFTLNTSGATTANSGVRIGWFTGKQGVTYAVSNYSPSCQLRIRYGSDIVLDTSGGTNTFVAPSNAKAELIWYIASGTTLTNYLLKPMICSKAAWDVSQKYVPYRPTYEETVEQVAENKTNISLIEQSGIHKNNLPLSLTEMKSINASGQGATWSDNVCTINGVTFTINDDYTITVGGQLSGAERALFRIFYNRPNSWGGQYLVGCPSGGSSTTYKLNLEQNGSPWSGISQDTGSGARVGTSTAANIYGYIDIKQTGALNLVFKPMIITEAMYNAGFTDYQQYAPTMGELYQMILSLQ